VTRARLLALIARASHAGTPTEEARTAAVIACKAMTDDPSLAMGADPDRSAAEEEVACERDAARTALASVTTERDAARAALENAYRELQALAARAATLQDTLTRVAEVLLTARPDAAAPAPSAPAPSAPAPSAPAPSAPAPSAPARATWKRSSFSRPKSMSARYAGRCACCGDTFPVGAWIQYDGNTRQAVCSPCVTSGEATG